MNEWSIHPPLIEIVGSPFGGLKIKGTVSEDPVLTLRQSVSLRRVLQRDELKGINLSQTERIPLN